MIDITRSLARFGTTSDLRTAAHEAGVDEVVTRYALNKCRSRRTISAA